MSKLLKKPLSETNDNISARFEKFNLKENPFPSEPVVNKESKDKRINGGIYESQIRSKEYDHIIENFIKHPQSDPNHIRLGFLMDTSYIGRGNGKSAFLINLHNSLNKEFCLDLSNELNKCFCVYVTPEPGGRSKTFPKVVDLIFKSILNSNIISTSLATLRLEALYQINPQHEVFNYDEVQIVKCLNDLEWLYNHDIDIYKLNAFIRQNEHLQTLKPDFPLFFYDGRLSTNIVTQKTFENFYRDSLRKGEESIDFVFSQLVKFFRAAGFNGAYIFIDDFERIPDFQSARQKKDFALELRSVLYDGVYQNAKIGFYNLLLVLHAGVPRLISDAWGQSGMENRAPLFSHTASKHIIPFDKLNKQHAILLINKYLKEFRIVGTDKLDITPFTEEAVERIGELSEYNAARILKFCYDLLDIASTKDDILKIDDEFIGNSTDIEETSKKDSEVSIDEIDSTDLIDKALNKNS